MYSKDSGMSYAVQTFNLSRKFGNDRIAVDSLSLKVKAGEIFALLGPNGAGKTTTIKMLCCLLKPSGGRAEILGKDVQTEAGKVKQVINVSPQETAVAMNLNLFENLYLVGKIYGLSSRNARQKSLEMIDLMGLGERKWDKVKKLSGGMLRRLSIAMAMISDPEVLFLDEPTIGLDAKARRSLWKMIESLKGKKTVLLTTHYLEEADYLADRVAIIDQGKLVAIGTPDELKQNMGGIMTITIKTDHLNSTAAEGIKKVYPLSETSTTGLVIKGKDLVFDDVIDLLRKEEVKVQWLAMNEPSLDDVYLKITGGDEADEIA